MNEFFKRDIACDKHNVKKIKKMDKSHLGYRVRDNLSQRLKDKWEKEQIAFIKFFKKKEATQLVKEHFER